MSLDIGRFLCPRPEVLFEITRGTRPEKPQVHAVCGNFLLQLPSASVARPNCQLEEAP